MTAKTNAIILAAGLGSRLRPLIGLRPKPLLRIDGTTIIERQIYFLRQRGVTDIFVLSGYKSEQLNFLKYKYGVKLIENRNYSAFGNAYSLFLAAEHLGNTWILEGDVFLNRNFIDTSINRPTYFVGRKFFLLGDGEIVFDRDKRITKMIPSPKTSMPTKNIARIFSTSGVSFWDANSSHIIRVSLTDWIANEPKTNKYPSWDHVVIENLHRIRPYAYKLHPTDWFEIDNEFDFKFANNILMRQREKHNNIDSRY